MVPRIRPCWLHGPRRRSARRVSRPLTASGGDFAALLPGLAAAELASAGRQKVAAGRPDFGADPARGATSGLSEVDHVARMTSSAALADTFPGGRCSLRVPKDPMAGSGAHAVVSSKLHKQPAWGRCRRSCPCRGSMRPHASAQYLPGLWVTIGSPSMTSVFTLPADVDHPVLARPAHLGARL